MKRVLITLLVVIALAAVVVATLLQERGERAEEVYAEEAVRRTITRTVRASGEIDARVTVDLSAHVVAKIEELYVEEGEEVVAGQPFLELEKEAFTAAVESWRAQLHQAESRVRQAEVELADAQVRLRRAERLMAEGIVSQEDLDSAKLRKESAELRLEEQRDSVAHARANLEKALDDFGKTTIYSPISGRVVSLEAEEGEVVVSGVMNNPATKIATVADLSELLAEIDVDENEIVAVEVGQPVEVRVDAVADRTYSGRVVEVGSSGFIRPGQGDVTFFEVDVLLDEPDQALRPGMSVRADVEVASHDDAVVVPIQAVVSRERPASAAGSTGSVDSADGRSTESAAPAAEAEDGEPEPAEVVYVIEDGVARRRDVETGLSTVTHVEIVSGLDGGEMVVTGPFRTLRDLEDGDPVTPEDQPEDSEESEESETERE